MESHQRVIQVIRHQKPDRTPLYGWVRENLSQEIAQAYGSVEAFEDHYEFDMAHLFGGPRWPFPYPEEVQNQFKTGKLLPRDALAYPLTDLDNMDAWQSLITEIRHHKEQRGRFVYVQSNGLFECYNTLFEIENHLRYLLEYEDDLHRLYTRQAEWNKQFAMRCLDLGVDMIHVSDDWGGQNNLLFSPKLWRRLIYPYHKTTADAVKARGAFLSLHSDGNINRVVDGILDIGFDVVHPWQESAGMSLAEYKEKYSRRFTVLGGLDVQTTLGFGKLDFLRAEIDRVLGLFPDGGLLFCTTHFVQNHCTIEELKFAFDYIYERIRRKN